MKAGIVLIISYLAALLVMCILVAVSCKAESRTYTLRAYLVDTPFQTQAQKKVAVYRAIKIVRAQTGIKIKPTFRRKTRAQIDAIKRGNIWCSGYIIYCPLIHTADLNLVYYGPDVYAGHLWFMGHAEKACKIGGAAAFWGGNRRDNGMSGVRMCSYGIAHELLHLLGMDDNGDGSECIIDWTGMLSCADSQPDLSVRGKAQVKECVS